MLNTLFLSVAILAAPGVEKPKSASNTRCPVLGNPVNKNLKVAVRGQEYFLCCKGCDKDLVADPDKYLNKDGTPKNAAKATPAPSKSGAHDHH